MNTYDLVPYEDNCYVHMYNKRNVTYLVCKIIVDNDKTIIKHNDIIIPDPSQVDTEVSNIKVYIISRFKKVEIIDTVKSPKVVETNKYLYFYIPPNTFKN